MAKQLTVPVQRVVMNWKDMLASMNADNANQCIRANHASAKRIIARCLSRGWWFASWRHAEDHYIVLSVAIDLQTDLRAKLSGIKFEVE